MIIPLLLWMALFVILLVFAIGGPREGGAMTIAYSVGMSLIHVTGVLPYLGFTANGDGLPDPDLTRAGFQLALIGMTTFVVGAVLARLFDMKRAAAAALSRTVRARALQFLSRRELGLGAVAYFVVQPLSHFVPSLTALVSPFATLLIIGLWLGLYSAMERRDDLRVLAVLGLAGLLPLATMSTGFLGYGTQWIFSVLAFQFVISRRRSWFYLAAPLAVYLGLSLFVSYMTHRLELRQVVWNTESTFADRFEQISAIFTDFQLFNIDSHSHAAAIGGRLNQNAYVGMAAEHIESGWVDFGYGETVPIWALIPRAVWPEKPAVGGGRDVVSRYTGVIFDAETSVGAGQVFEFYVNFGTPGVVIGFFLLGFGLLWLDRGIMRAIAADDVRGLLLRAMPGLTMLQPGGNLMEIIVGIVAAIIVARLLVNFHSFHLIRTARAGFRAN